MFRIDFRLPVGMLVLFLLSFVSQGAAASQIYRCGNEYTNQASRIKQGGCVPVAGQVTRVARPDVNWARPASNSKRSTTPPRVQRTNHVPAPQQQARDRDARAILQAELNKASARLRELQLEYNHGQPERLGSELSNHQKYLNRVAGLRNDIQRVESDLAGLRRELGRAGG